MSGLNSALASITASYTDSDDDEEERTLSPEDPAEANVNEISTTPKDDDFSNNIDHDHYQVTENVNKRKRDSPSPTSRGGGLVNYFDPIDDDAIDDYTPEKNSDLRDEDSIDTSPSPSHSDSELACETAAKRRALLPPEPKGNCSAKLQSKFNKLYEYKLSGNVNMNAYIQNKKSFRNPSIYEKLIEYCGIKEFGSNYPLDIYNPFEWPESSNYTQLAKLQKEEMERREKARKDRVKIEYVSGAAKKPIGVVTSIPISSMSTTSAQVVMNPNTTESTDGKRKSKWDQKGVLPLPVIIPRK